MKKRSLFAAVAMLIVSALVLTSATYAWFANGSTAQVNKIAASATGANGLVKVCTTDDANIANWKQQLAYSDFEFTSDTFTVNPIDVRPANTPVWYNCTYTGQSFSATAPANGADFGGVYYDFYVKAWAVSGGSIDCTIAWDQGNNQAFVYALVVVDGTANYLFGKNESGTYKPFTNPGDCAESNSNGIVDNSDLTADSESTVTIAESDVTLSGLALTQVTGGYQLILANAQTAHHIEVYLWAEGQDPQCVQNNKNIAAGLTFSQFDYLPPA